METNLVIGGLVVILALAFAFSTGFNDAANVVAVVISTRALSPLKAILAASIFEFIGAYYLGTAVAETMGKGIIDPNLVSGDKYGIIIIFATLLGATSWNVVCTIFAFPVSASHALLGGLVGAAIGAGGLNLVQWQNVSIIFFVLIFSPILGLISSSIITKLGYFLSTGATPKINKLLAGLEIGATFGFALAHGTNDGQKPMGIIVFSLIVLGLYEPVAGAFVPNWVMIACGLSIALGILTGGRNVIKTVGMKYYRINHMCGFCAQTSSMVVIYIASVLGLPVSTTQTISGAVMGAGAAKRIKAVRWGLGFDVFLVWLITIPATAVVSGLLYLLILNGAKFLGL